jgi:hypothetical protein
VSIFTILENLGMHDLGGPDGVPKDVAIQMLEAKQTKGKQITTIISRILMEKIT